MKTLLAFIARRRVMAHGREKAAAYVRAVEAIAGNVDAAAISFAETVCPMLKHYRRRARACAKVANRI